MPTISKCDGNKDGHTIIFIMLYVYIALFWDKIKRLSGRYSL